MGKTEENDKSNLKLKSVSKPGGSFGIHSLNNFREVGSYTWIAREITDEMGFPDCVKDTDDCHCCEGQLFVLRHGGTEETNQSTDSFGQVLTMINHETGNTNIFTRAVHPLDINEWQPWQMVATGDPKLIAENNSINEVLSALRQQVENDSKRIETAENSLLASATVRFDRIEENETTINAGEIDSTPTAIVYYKPTNKFVAADSAGNYWDSWDGMEAYMSGDKIREDKVYLCGSIAYTWDGAGFSNCVSEEFAEVYAEVRKTMLEFGKPIVDVFESKLNTVEHTVYFDAKAAAEIKIKLELSTAYTGSEINIYIKDSALATNKWIGKISNSGRNVICNHIIEADSKDAYIFYKTGSSGKGLTFTATIEQINSLQTRIEDVHECVNTLTERIEAVEYGVTEIGGKLKEYKTVERTGTESGFINKNGQLSASGWLAVDYYNISDDNSGYKVTTDIEGTTGVYALHFFGDSDAYLGYADTSATVLDEFLFAIPFGTIKIAVNRKLNDDFSKLSIGTDSSITSLSDRIALIEKSAVLGKKIIALGDSITMIKDDNNKSYIDYITEMTNSVAYNAGVGGSRFSIVEECFFIKFTSIPQYSGQVTIKGADGIPPVIFDVVAGDGTYTVAGKFFEALRSLANGDILAYNIVGNEVTVRNWSGSQTPVDISKIVCENAVGVVIEARKNKYGMFETFISDYIAYSNLEIPCMAYGFITGDWRCQRLAAEYLDSNGSSGWTAKIDTFSSVDIGEIDIVTVLGGANNYARTDWGESDDYSQCTMSGGINTIIKEFLTANPNLKIVFFTTIPKYFGEDLANWDDTLWCDNYITEKHNKTYPELIAKVTEVVKRNHIPIYDLYYNMGWNKWNFREFFRDNDGAHPYKGLKWIGEKIVKCIS